jgi:hypothetical protein
MVFGLTFQGFEPTIHCTQSKPIDNVLLDGIVRTFVSIGISRGLYLCSTIGGES